MILAIIISFIRRVGFHWQGLFQIMVNQRDEMMTIRGFA
jgi:hypothetical protein